MVNKLVRDRIPDIVAAEGRTLNVRVLDDREFDAALLSKLVEEVAELLDAGPEERLNEAADVYEVLLTILATQGLSAGDLTAAASEKRRTRGSFTQRLWWDAD